MKVGDLVKRKPEWGAWVKQNPWMYTAKDLEIGVIVERVRVPGERNHQAFQVLWPDGLCTKIWDSELEAVNESR